LDIGHNISDMQASIHGWITPTISTTNKTMVVLQQSASLPKPNANEEMSGCRKEME
jgi:hypothetical protein